MILEEYYNQSINAGKDILPWYDNYYTNFGHGSSYHHVDNDCGGGDNNDGDCCGTICSCACCAVLVYCINM